MVSRIQKKKIQIENVEIFVSPPFEVKVEWMSREEPLKQLQAAWLTLGDDDIPMSPRIVGKPGVGKTTLACACAMMISRSVYIFQATMDTRPEDLVITPQIAEGRKIIYVASPIVSAMITGGIVVIDEGNRMNERSWASLAPLLDFRGYLESVILQIKIPMHPDFRLCVTMNDDVSTFELPDYIRSRLQPKIMLDFPSWQEEEAILRYNLPFITEEIIEYTISFLQSAHRADKAYSVRDGINLARYCMKLAHQEGKFSIDLMIIAISQILGSESLEFLEASS